MNITGMYILFQTMACLTAAMIIGKYLNLFFIWYIYGFLSGSALFVMKYAEYHNHEHEYMKNPEARELFKHDHKISMIIRNFLFYCCLSWYGFYCFIEKED